jgi:hypothetical protein
MVGASLVDEHSIAELAAKHNQLLNALLLAADRSRMKLLCGLQRLRACAMAAASTACRPPLPCSWRALFAAADQWAQKPQRSRSVTCLALKLLDKFARRGRSGIAPGHGESALRAPAAIDREAFGFGVPLLPSLPCWRPERPGHRRATALGDLLECSAQCLAIDWLTREAKSWLSVPLKRWRSIPPVIPTDTKSSRFQENG